MPLIPTLKAAVVEHGLFEAGAPLDAAAAFALVRDMPYQRASSRDPEMTIAEWRGTCSGKHILLQALFEELGMAASMLLAPHEFTEASAPWLPPALLEEVRRAPVLDVHNFLRVEVGNDGEWMTADATWPLAASALGLPVNEEFIAGHDMELAADPTEIHHVPPDLDPSEMKERIVADWSPEQRTRRELFLADLTDWPGGQLPAVASHQSHLPLRSLG